MHGYECHSPSPVSVANVVSEIMMVLNVVSEIMIANVVSEIIRGVRNNDGNVVMKPDDGNSPTNR